MLYRDTFTLMLKALARKVLPTGVRRALRRWLGGSRDAQETVSVSFDYEIMESEVPPELLRGWQNQTVAVRQHRAFAPLLEQMYGGKPREDFAAIANAVRMSGLEDPLIVEAGCGSGWNSEVLTYLLKRPVRYIGLDYSPAMTSLGKRYYPDSQFAVGDATALPLRDEACDILISGGVLMHLLGYREAIYESRRVARHWCIFHTVPVLHRRETTVLRKRAYGESTVEVIFNEGELYHLLEQCTLAVRHVLGNIPYDLKAVLGEPTATKTYVCEVMGN